MKILRTPDACFENLPNWPYEPCYTEVPSGDGGTLRLHHVDTGPRDGAIVVCMHGQPTWSYLYRHMIPLLVDAGLRVLAPDLVGFGRSDKPADREDYSYQRQVDWLSAWLCQNDVKDATLVVQDWGGLVGLRVLADNPKRFSRVVASNTGLPAPTDVSPERVAAVKMFLAGPTPSIVEMMKALGKRDPSAPERSFAYWQKWTWDTEDIPIGLLVGGLVDGRALSAGEIAAYDAPFPDASFKMGPRAMPSLVPTLPDDPALPAQIAAWTELGKWTRPFLCAFTDNDPITAGADRAFNKRIPGAQNQAHITIEGGGHFVQEGRAEQFVAAIVDLVRSS